MKTLLEKYISLFALKNSFLCIGLDPALPQQRDKCVIVKSQKSKVKSQNINTIRLNFCLGIIKKTYSSAIAVKVNEQYVKGFTEKEHKKITEECKKNDLISIYDCKLNDISDTVESSIYWINRWGYDAFTTNVFPGNLKDIVRIAHNYNPSLGVIPLLLMSNLESKKYFIQAKVGRNPLFLEIAKEVRNYCVDGCVIGASNFIKREMIKNILEIIGKNKIILVPGIGTQGGEIEKFAFAIRNQKNFQISNKSLLPQYEKEEIKERVSSFPLLINVGRDIIYSNNPSQKAKFYKHKLMSFFN